MKTIKKIVAIALSLAMTLSMLLSMTVVSFADGTGSITITNAVCGKTYNAYKVFDALYNSSTKATTYYIQGNDDLLNAVKDAASPFEVISTDSLGRSFIAVKGDKGADDIKSWVEALITDSKITQTASETGTESNEVVLNVPYGYYFVKSNVGTVVMINTAAPDVTIIDKNDLGITGTKTADKTTADVGSDEVTFTLVFDAKNYITKFNETSKEYESVKVESYFVDEIPVAVLKQTDYIIKLYDNEKCEGNPTKTLSTADFSVNADGDITIPWISSETKTFLYSSHVWVQITFKGVLTSDAIKSGSDFVGKGTNSVEFYVKPLGGEKEKFATATVDVYTFSLDIHKFAEDGTTALPGAEFILYKKSTDATPVNLYYSYDETNKKVVWQNSDTDATKATVSENTTDLEFKGIAAGTYYVKEIVAPEGYKLPANDFELVITESSPGVFTATFNSVEANPVNGVITASITNSKGLPLPITGDVGTVIFIALGALLVAGAAVMLVAKKRMSMGE